MSHIFQSMVLRRRRNRQRCVPRKPNSQKEREQLRREVIHPLVKVRATNRVLVKPTKKCSDIDGRMRSIESLLYILSLDSLILHQFFSSICEDTKITMASLYPSSSESNGGAILVEIIIQRSRKRLQDLSQLKHWTHQIIDAFDDDHVSSLMLVPLISSIVKDVRSVVLTDINLSVLCFLLAQQLAHEDAGVEAYAAQVMAVSSIVIQFAVCPVIKSGVTAQMSRKNQSSISEFAVIIQRLAAGQCVGSEGHTFETVSEEVLFDTSDTCQKAFAEMSSQLCKLGEMQCKAQTFNAAFVIDALKLSNDSLSIILQHLYQMFCLLKHSTGLIRNELEAEAECGDENLLVNLESILTHMDSTLSRNGLSTIVQPPPLS